MEPGCQHELRYANEHHRKSFVPLDNDRKVARSFGRGELFLFESNIPDQTFVNDKG